MFENAREPKKRQVLVNFIELKPTLDNPENLIIANVFSDMKSEYDYLYAKGVITSKSQYIYNSPDTIVYNCPIDTDDSGQIIAQIERLFEYSRNNPDFSITVPYFKKYSSVLLVLTLMLSEESQSTQNQIVMGTPIDRIKIRKN